jgi:hypothetical protein
MPRKKLHSGLLLTGANLLEQFLCIVGVDARSVRGDPPKW